MATFLDTSHIFTNSERNQTGKKLQRGNVKTELLFRLSSLHSLKLNQMNLLFVLFAVPPLTTNRRQCAGCNTSTQDYNVPWAWSGSIIMATMDNCVMFCQQKTDNSLQKMILTLNRWWPHVHALNCRLVVFLSEFGVLDCPRWFVVVVAAVVVEPNSLCYTLMWITKKCILLGLIWERAL